MRLPVFAVTFALAAQQPPLEKRAVELARRLPVSTLDTRLPKQPLSRWLTRAVGPDVKIDWEVNDCGEQSGNPEIDRGRDFPLCVDAIANLPGGRRAIVSIVMGSFGKGIAGPPQLLSVNLLNGNRIEPIPQLRNLPARIKAVN